MNQLKTDPGDPVVYQIRIKAILVSMGGLVWGLAITLEDSGIRSYPARWLIQACVAWLASKVRDLGMPLVSVNCVKTR